MVPVVRSGGCHMHQCSVLKYGPFPILESFPIIRLYWHVHFPTRRLFRRVRNTSPINHYFIHSFQEMDLFRLLGYPTERMTADFHQTVQTFTFCHILSSSWCSWTCYSSFIGVAFILYFLFKFLSVLMCVGCILSNFLNRKHHISSYSRHEAVRCLFIYLLYVHYS